MAFPRTSRSRTPLRMALAGLGLALLAACAEDGSGAPAPADGEEPPAADSPEAPETPRPDTGELLRTRHAATVLDDGEGAELCLGGVAESYPPQCGGPALPDWDWGQHEGEYEEQSGVRWGEFTVVGYYDADRDAFEVQEVFVDGEPVPPAEEEPSPAGAHVDAEELTGLPGYLASSDSTDDAPATVDVIYDDGTLQAHLDAEYGEGAVQVRSALVPAG